MLKIGIIGGGVGSAVGYAHVSAMRMTGQIEIIGGYFSSDLAKCRESAEGYGAPHHYSSIGTMLAIGQPDRVVVLSPTPQHYGHVDQCLRSGVPVLCEKALCETSAGAALLADFSDKLRVPLSCVFNYVFYPAVRELKRIVQGKDLGRITNIHIEMPQQSYLTGTPQRWRLTDKMIHLDLGVHVHHMLNFLLEAEADEIETLEAAYSDVGVIDYVTGIMTFKDVLVNAWYGKVCAGYNNGLRIRVFGTAGSVEWYQMQPDILKISNAIIEIANPRFKLGHPTGFVEALANMYGAWIMDPKHPDLSAELAITGLRTIERGQK